MRNEITLTVTAVQPPGYGEAMPLYRSAGWLGTLPLPPRRKASPPSGWTGREAPYPSYADCQAWADEHANGNIALRMPTDVIGIDVDAYGTKNGAAELARLEAAHGELPPTWTSTSRDDGVSGIRFYRVPAGFSADAFRDPSAGIEIIRSGHRYAVVWPSTHPEGRKYAWIGPDGQRSERVPSMTELPELPIAWARRLTAATAAEVVAPEDGDPFAAPDNTLTFNSAATATEYLQKARAGLRTLDRPGNGRMSRELVGLALKSGHLLAPLGLAEDKARAALLADAKANGMVKAYGEAACLTQINNGLRDGQRTPWVVNAAAAEPDPEATDAPPLATLPAEFWESRECLRHIRQAAHARTRSADVVFHSVLARLAAMHCHGETLDTGIGGGPASLNYFAAIVGPSGVGKSSGISIAKRLLTPTEGVDLADDLPIGSGEGLAEAFMGIERRETGEMTPGGKARMKDVRCQVRNNAFLYADEGEALVKMLERSGATIGEALRRAWTGGTLGQRNGTAETTRVVKGDSYSLGLVIGFQPGTALPLLADSHAGTPQRFLWVSARDATIPDEPVEAPAHPLVWKQLASGWTHEMTLAQPIRDELRLNELRQARGEATAAELDAHEPLARIKVAALLALLENRHNVTEDDWELSGVVWRTSCAVRDRLVEYGRERSRAEYARDTQRYAERESAAAAAVTNADTARVARWAVLQLKGKGAMTDGALKRSAAGRDRAHYEAAIEAGVTRGWIRRTADGLLEVAK